MTVQSPKDQARKPKKQMTVEDKKKKEKMDKLCNINNVKKM